MKYYIASRENLAGSGLGLEPWRKCIGGRVVLNESEVRRVFGSSLPDWLHQTTHDGAIGFLRGTNS